LLSVGVGYSWLLLVSVVKPQAQKLSNLTKTLKTLIICGSAQNPKENLAVKS
jgi:hypothetical protein